VRQGLISIAVLASCGLIAVFPASIAASVTAAALAHNPCAFLDPAKPDVVAPTAGYLTPIVGAPPHAKPVQIVTGAVGDTGPDYQDGICELNGELGWYGGVTKPCVPPAENKTCSPAYVLLAVITAPLADEQADLSAFGATSYVVHTGLPDTGGHGTLGCTTSSRCDAWFTKGTKFVLMYNQNVELPASGFMIKAARAVYEHASLTSGA
jgi:hypothetical protein